MKTTSRWNWRESARFLLEALPALLFASLYAARAERVSWPWTLSDPGSEWSVKFVRFTPDNRSIEVEQRHFSRNEHWRQMVDIRRRTVSRSWRAPGGAVSPDGRTLAGSEESGRLRLWDAASNRLLHTLPGGDLLGYGYAPGRMVAFSPDSRLLARAGGSMAEIRDVASGRLLHTLRVGGQLLDLEFSPDGKTLAIGTSQLQIWDVNTGRLLKSATTPEVVFAVAFSPDGLNIATLADEFGVLEIRDVRTLRILKTMKAEDMSFSIDYSPDGRFIACGSYAEYVRLWDARTGKLSKVLRGHRDDVDFVQFSPDGRFLASESSDGTVKVWRIR